VRDIARPCAANDIENQCRKFENTNRMVVERISLVSKEGDISQTWPNETIAPVPGESSSCVGKWKNTFYWPGIGGKFPRLGR